MQDYPTINPGLHDLVIAVLITQHVEVQVSAQAGRTVVVVSVEASKLRNALKFLGNDLQWANTTGMAMTLVEGIEPAGVSIELPVQGAKLAAFIAALRSRAETTNTEIMVLAPTEEECSSLFDALKVYFVDVYAREVFLSDTENILHHHGI